MRPRLALIACVAILLCAFVSAVNREGSVPKALPEDKGNEIKLEVGRDRIKLDQLGPTIVTEDGQLRRIADWDQLSAQEQATAWKRIRQRNEARLAALREKVKVEDAGDSTLREPAPEQLKDTAALEVERGEHLSKFVDALGKLQQGGGTGDIPGFAGATDLLKDPRLTGREAVDLKKLRETLEKLKEKTERIKRSGGAVKRDEL